LYYLFSKSCYYEMGAHFQLYIRRPSDEDLIPKVEPALLTPTGDQGAVTYNHYWVGGNMKRQQEPKVISATTVWTPCYKNCEPF
jgi:hypothetical protein